MAIGSFNIDMSFVNNMSFTLEKVVPWGRSFDEYLAMFALDEDDLQKFILGCGDGPASFNYRLTSRGGKVVSADPIYQLSTQQLAVRIDETFEIVIEQTRKNSTEFVWEQITSIENLAKLRMEAMKEFLADFSRGKKEKRYICSELPRLDFPKKNFDLALCSHFLFLYSEQLDLSFHLRAIKNLCLVAPEVRVFPLLELGSKKSRHLPDTLAALTAENYQISVEKVKYEFQKGGNEMLRIKAPA